MYLNLQLLTALNLSFKQGCHNFQIFAHVCVVLSTSKLSSLLLSGHYLKEKLLIKHKIHLFKKKYLKQITDLKNLVLFVR